MFWKSKSNNKKNKCKVCGQIHDDWPALTFSIQSSYHELTESERESITKIDSDFCEIKYEDQIDKFIRVTLI